MKYLALILFAFLLAAMVCPTAVGQNVAATASSPAAGIHPAQTNTANALPARRSHWARVHPDPRGIPVGISYKEMIRRFGAPSMKVTDAPGKTTLSYSRRKSRVQVEVENGKVISVTPVKPVQDALVLPRN